MKLLGISLLLILLIGPVVSQHHHLELYYYALHTCQSSSQIGQTCMGTIELASDPTEAQFKLCSGVVQGYRDSCCRFFGSYPIYCEARLTGT